MFIRWLLSAALVVAFAQAGGARPDEEAFASQVSESDLRRYVRELVAFGPRMGGTPSNDKSAAYLTTFFRKHGLDVAVPEDPPALAHWETAWSVALADGVRIESAKPHRPPSGRGGSSTRPAPSAARTTRS
jgi:hypothetical protein